MKDSKYYRRMLIKNNGNDKKWLTKMLLSIIVVLVSLIITNFDKDVRSEFKWSCLVKDGCNGCL